MLNMKNPVFTRENGIIDGRETSSEDESMPLWKNFL